MLNLKLLMALQPDSTTSLVLRPSSPGMLTYFIMASSIVSSVVVSGECEGELPSNDIMSFSVSLAAVAPLLDKNYVFRLSYSGGVLRFIEATEKFTIEPLNVEHIASDAAQLMARYMKCTTAAANAMDKEGNLQDTDSIRAVDYTKLKKIASIAAHSNTVVSLCDNFAVVNLGTAYVIQKINCGVKSIQGKLLQRLLAQEDGYFFEHDESLVYLTSNGKDENKCSVCVFVSPYLPSTDVDTTILTRGAVLEKYTLNLKGILKIMPSIQGKFGIMKFCMGSSYCEFSNDRGERLVHKYDVEDAKTLELNRLMRGDTGAKVVMSDIDVPKVVQKVLQYMKDEFTIYVKERKVIFQSDNLYIVCGR